MTYLGEWLALIGEDRLTRTLSIPHCSIALAISRSRRRSRWLPDLAGYLGIPLDVLLNVDPSAPNLPDHIRKIRDEAIAKVAKRRLDDHLARRVAKAVPETLADAA